MSTHRVAYSLAVLLVSATVGCTSERVPVDTQVSGPCPLRLSVNTPATGWTVTQGDTSARLVGITFYDGAPKEEASLVPDSTTHVGDTDVAVWVFPKTGGRAQWLACRYERTGAVVARALAPSVRSASATYDAKGSIEGLPTILKLVLKP